MPAPKDPAKHDAWRRRLSEIQKGRHYSPSTEFTSERVSGRKNPFYGKHHSEEIKRRLSLIRQGRKVGSFTLEHRRRISQALIGHPPTRTGPLSPECIEKIRRTKLRQWRDPKHRERTTNAWYEAIRLRPNKAEVKLLNILQQISPNWGYVGDGTLIIDGRCPDFHDGNDHLAELFGDYWHKDDDPQERIDFFRKHGYECTVIWEHELADPQLVIERIGGGSCA